MKRSLTLALVFAVMAAFAGLSATQGAQKKDQKSPTTSSVTTTAPTTAPATAEKATTANGSKSNNYRVATQVMTGKVVSVDKVANTFTVVANGKQVTFFANKLMLPDVGQMMDIHYIQPTPGGTMEATTIQPTPGGTFAVTNLNSSRSNISRVGNTSANPSATIKAVEPPPKKPKQEVSISEGGTKSATTSTSPVSTPGPVGATTIHGSKSNSSERLAAAPSNVMTGKVLSLDKTANTFTVMSKGNKVVFIMKKGDALPEVGKIIDITYIQTTPGGPFNATTTNNSRSNSY